jgi:hypothetical protein
VLKDIPRLTAIARVAPTVRFKAFAIFAAPRFSFAIVFNKRWSSLVHTRRAPFFFFGIHPFLFKNRAFITAKFVRNGPSFAS